MDIIRTLIYFFPMSVHSLGISEYLPVNEEALAWEIHCNDAGSTIIPPGTEYPPRPEIHPTAYAESVTTGRILREFQIVYITVGEGWFKDRNHEPRRIKAGDMFILYPGIEHAYAPSKQTGWHEHWVGFSGKHASRLYRNGFLNPDEPVKHMGIKSELVDDYGEILSLCREQTPGFQIGLGALVLRLIAHIHENRAAERTGKNESGIIETVRGIMELHLESGIEVHNLAKEIGIGYDQLLEVFHKYTGLTPYDYFLQMRMHYAKRLLLHPDMSVKETAARMNFRDQYYFSRLFKKKTGITPTQWKTGKFHPAEE